MTVKLYLFPHNLRVCSVNEYGVGEPSQHELEICVAGLDVRGITGILRLRPLDVQSDADLSILGGGELSLVQPVGLGVGPDLIVGGGVDLVADALDPRGVGALPVPENRLYPGLIQRYPQLDL